jgi:outer membrane lipoprotein-sorting protein
MTGLLGAVLVVSSIVLASQAPKTASTGSKEAMAVVDKLIQALGGRKALEAIKDTTISGTAEIVEYGLTVPITIYQKEPNKLRIDITIAEANMTIIQAYDGQKGWYTNPQTGGTEEMPEFMAKELARQAAETQSLLYPQKIGVTYALKPKATLEGKDCIVLEQTQADGHKATIYLDPETYLPCKTETRTFDQAGAEVDAESYATNYQEVGGTMVPFSLRILQDGTEAQRITITAVTHNTNLDDAFFTLK